jgi:hypothetical protein
MKAIKAMTLYGFMLVGIGLLTLASCKKQETIEPKITSIDPVEAAGNNVVTVLGENLQNIVSIVLDNGNVNVGINPNFNTNTAIIFRLPAAANVGPQRIVFTTLSGFQFSIPFNILAVPTLSSVLPTEWEAGSNITITGNYLDNAEAAALTATGEALEIVSKTATQVVLKMPAASTATSSKITVTNTAGPTTSEFEVINMDKNFKMISEGFAPGVQNWSWATVTESSEQAVAGTMSVKSTYGAGGWQGASFKFPIDDLNATNIAALHFWVRGGVVDQQAVVKGDNIVSGSAKDNIVSIPAGRWTKIVVPGSGFEGLVFGRLNIQMMGPDGADETVFFDNMFFQLK